MVREALAALPARRTQLRLWRAVRPGYDPLSTRGARLHGGRWNSPGTAVLYTSTEPATVRAELLRQGQLQGLREAELHPLVAIELSARPKLVRLISDEVLERVGVGAPVSVLSDLDATRRVGDAAAELGIEALLVPSVAVPAQNVVLFPAGIAGELTLEASHQLRSPAAWARLPGQE